jgi:FKBP-type peptidyl-prolyl cis-trans isomerase 2
VLELQAEGEEEPMPALITAVEEDGCVVDSNHPLAGKELHYRLQLVNVLG